jgi:demethylmenaquinone methyltransferase / 2-methoxy-6-polyprenyl-1,4-benzoquinol methylase
MKEKKERVRKMFDDISDRYDFLNHFLSFGIDRIWRKKMVSLLAARHPEVILDVATGTADLAIELSELKPKKIVGIDISEKMLSIGQGKIVGKGLVNTITLKLGDAEKIPFSDNTYDAITVAFGVRNFEDLQKGLREMNRVLRPGGIMMILEFSHPTSSPMKQLYAAYSQLFIPMIGKLISRHPEAYQYLPDSVKAFPSGNNFLEILTGIGLKNVSQLRLSLGISSIYMAEK